MANKENSASKEFGIDMDQLYDEPDEEDFTDEEWEEILKEEKHRDECANHAADALIELARVSPAAQKRFRDGIYKLVSKTHNDCAFRNGKLSGAFVELERNIRAARVATFKLTKRERVYLDHAIPTKCGFFDWADILSFINGVCADLTGKNPYPHVRSRTGRGRRRGDVKDYPLKQFVQSLTRELRDTGGRLTLDVKGRRGTWIKALDMLRPLLPARFIPKAPPLSTIERWIREEEKAPF